MYLIIIFFYTNFLRELLCTKYWRRGKWKSKRFTFESSYSSRHYKLFQKAIFYCEELGRASNDDTEVFNLDREYLHALGEVSPKKRDVEWKR